MGIYSLNAEETHLVNSYAGGSVRASAVARLYTAQGHHWTYSNVYGGAALVQDDNNVNRIRLVDLTSGQIVWEQEIYERFEYQSPTPFFHTFEGDESVIGLSFADEGDASIFYNAVTSLENANKLAVPKLGISPRAVPLTAGSAIHSPRKLTPPAPQHSTPSSGGGAPSFTPPPLARSTSTPTGLSTGSTTVSTASKKVPAPAKKRGWFGKLTEKMGFGEGEADDDVVLSKPTGFRHESHIGWDAANGFEIRNVSPYLCPLVVKRWWCSQTQLTELCVSTPTTNNCYRFHQNGESCSRQQVSRRASCATARQPSSSWRQWRRPLSNSTLRPRHLLPRQRDPLLIHHHTAPARRLRPRRAHTQLLLHHHQPLYMPLRPRRHRLRLHPGRLPHSVDRLLLLHLLLRPLPLRRAVSWPVCRTCTSSLLKIERCRISTTWTRTQPTRWPTPWRGRWPAVVWTCTSTMKTWTLRMSGAIKCVCVKERGKEQTRKKRKEKHFILLCSLVFPFFLSFFACQCV